MKRLLSWAFIAVFKVSRCFGHQQLQLLAVRCLCLLEESGCLFGAEHLDHPALTGDHHGAIFGGNVSKGLFQKTPTHVSPHVFSPPLEVL